MTIPRKIHYCWLSGDPYPELVTRCMASWRCYMPEYEFVLWDAERFDVASVPWVAQAVSRGKYAFAADYIRMYALVHEGGIYLDSDVEVFESFDRFLHHQAFSGIEYWPDIGGLGIEGAVVGARAGHRWLEDCLEHYNGRDFIRADGTLDEYIVSGVFATRAERFGYRFAAEDQALSDGIHIYAPTVFAHSGMEVEPGVTAAMHHCRGSWRDVQPLPSRGRSLWNQVLRRLQRR